MPVVLRDADNPRVGRLAEPGFDAFDREVPEFWICEAKLGALGRAFAFDEAEPFRVFGKMLLGWDEGIESVDKPFVRDASALFRRDARGLTVVAVAPSPVRLEGRI